MLTIQKGTLTLKDSGRTLLRDFSFTLRPGDRAAVIGEEGNGKSTLLKWIAGSGAVEDYCDVTGEVVRGGLRLGYLEQELAGEWMDRSAAAFFAGLDLYETPELWTMGFDLELAGSSRTMASLSGGEKVKARLAKLLAARPDVLLLDEPTNDLDVSTLEWMEGFLRRCPLPVMFISHDETLIEAAANVIIHIEQLRRKTEPRHTIERTTYREYVRRRAGRLEKQEQVARKQQAEYRAQMDRWRQIYSKVEHRQDSITRQNPSGGRLLKNKIHSLKSQEKRLEREAGTFEEMPDREEAIRFEFGEGSLLPPGKRVLEYDRPVLAAGDRVLARNLRLTVYGSQHVTIVGANGAGKTTLMRELWACLRCRTDIRPGYMPQNYGDILEGGESPAAFLAPGGDKAALTRARTRLGSLKFTPEEMERPARELSGGQKAKLILLKLALDGCDVLLLDEPTRNLSPLSAPVIREMLAGFPGALVCVTHDRMLIGEMAGPLYLLDLDGLHPQDR